MCKYCQGDIDNRQLIINLEETTLYVDEAGRLTVGFPDGDFLEAQIEYCPMCGRKLENRLRG